MHVYMHLHTYIYIYIYIYVREEGKVYSAPVRLAISINEWQMLGRAAVRARSERERESEREGERGARGKRERERGGGNLGKGRFSVSALLALEFAYYSGGALVKRIKSGNLY